MWYLFIYFRISYTLYFDHIFSYPKSSHILSHFEALGLLYMCVHMCMCAHGNVCSRTSFTCFSLDFDETPNKEFLVLNSNAFETKAVISLAFIHIQVYKALSWAHHTSEPHSQLMWQV